MNYKKYNIKIYCSFILFFLILNDYINLFFSKNNKGRIFLCTTYNNEAEILYIHLWRLYDYVDKFIIVISNITHSGLPKNVTFNSYKENIKKYKNKIDLVYFNNICNKKEYPDNIEKSQRDYAKYYIEEKYHPNNKDLLIVLVLDEILTREGIEYIKKNPPKDFYFIKGSMYFPYYYHRVSDWDKSFIVRYNKNMKTLSKYRRMKNTKNNTLIYEFNSTKPLITHCSYCFKTIEEYRYKLQSFGHQEFNRPPYITNNWIFKSHYCRQKIAKSSYGYDEPYEGWSHLIPNDDRLKYLIDRSFIFQIEKTTYTKEHLKKLCSKTFNRKPFELSAKYKQ